jgi:hypothetical protein
MSDAAELVLATEAILHGLRTTGCCEWDDDAAERVRNDPSLQGLTPEYIRDRLCLFIAVEGGSLQQVKESRPEYSYRTYWYKAVFPEPGFKHGIFVELELTETDPQLPGVTIFNAHPQRR